MNNLTNGKIVPTIPSYEVARMIEREHRDVLRMLEGCEKPKIVGIIPTLKQMVELPLADYFIESSYNDRGRELKCYECTKMGCELLANKLTGEKGILFSAKYVKIFNEMELEKEQLQLTNEDKAILNIIHAGDNLSRTLAIQDYKTYLTANGINKIIDMLIKDGYINVSS